MNIEINSVSYIYGKKTPFEHRALNYITTRFEKGKFYAIVGQTGSGKSTLIQHLNAILKPTEGKIVIGDTTITRKTKSKYLSTIRKNVGMVFQFPEYQIFEETVEKDIIFGPLNYGMDKQEAINKARTLVKNMGLEEEILSKSPFALSGGQKRRIAIAGVLAMEPQILVLDEPTVGLDPKGQNEIMEMFKNLHETLGITIILISHQMDVVLKYADEVKVIKAGEIIVEDTPENVLTNEELIKQTHLRIPNVIQLQKAIEEKHNMKFEQIAKSEEMLTKMYRKWVAENE